jgi:hypothetical protein
MTLEPEAIITAFQFKFKMYQNENRIITEDLRVVYLLTGKYGSAAMQPEHPK